MTLAEQAVPERALTHPFGEPAQEHTKPYAAGSHVGTSKPTAGEA